MSQIKRYLAVCDELRDANPDERMAKYLGATKKSERRAQTKYDKSLAKARKEGRRFEQKATRKQKNHMNEYWVNISKATHREGLKLSKNRPERINRVVNSGRLMRKRNEAERNNAVRHNANLYHKTNKLRPMIPPERSPYMKLNWRQNQLSRAKGELG